MKLKNYRYFKIIIIIIIIMNINQDPRERGDEGNKKYDN
jgi:hypothetical protein